MGRGNVCVHGKYEGLYYINWNNFSSEWEDENGIIIKDDYELQNEEWENSLFQFKEDMKQRFKSFRDSESYLGNSEKIVLENELFYIVTEDNEWSIAIKLIQKEQGYYSRGNIENLQSRKYQIYLEGMKECLFEQFDEIGVYGGAWTSGRIQKCA